MTPDQPPSDPVRGLVADSFRPLDELGAGLADRVVRYVCDDLDPGVLDVLSRTPEAGVRIGLGCLYPQFMIGRQSPSARLPWDEILDRAEGMPPGVLLRLARALHAGAQTAIPAGAMGGLVATPAMLSVSTYTSVPGWAETLVRLATRRVDGLAPGREPGDRLPAILVERLLELDGHSPDLIYRDVFPRAGSVASLAAGSLFRTLAGFRDRLAERPEIVSAALTQAEAPMRSLSLSIFKMLRLPVAHFVEPLAALAVGSSANLRGEAASLVREAGPLALPPLKALAESGSPAARGHALRLIDRLGLPEGREYLRSRLGVEKTAAVREVLEGLVGDRDGRAAVDGEPGSAPGLPPVDPFVGVGLGGDALAAVTAWLEERFPLSHQGWLERLLSPRPWSEGPEYSSEIPPADQDAALGRLLRRPELTTLHMVRLLRLARILQPHPSPDFASRNLASPPDRLEALLSAYREAHSPRVGFRELAAAFSASAMDPELLPNLWYGHREGQLFQWEAEAIWPFFADRFGWLAEELDQGPRGDEFERYVLGMDWRALRALAILDAFPAVPASLVPRVWRIAEGGKQSLRPAARRLLEKLPEARGRLLESLADGKADRRAAAAEWLGQWKPPGAAEALRQAMEAEKVAAVRTAIGRALELLGESAKPTGQANPADLIDRLRKEAARGLKMGIPEKLSWFPFDRLPEVRWRHDGAPVERPVRDWLVVSAWKAKSAEPSEDLRGHASLLHPEDFRGLGRSAFEAWLAEDLKPQSEQLRREQLASFLHLFGVSTVEELLRAQPDMAQAIERQKDAPGMGNVADKGLLAVAAVAGPPEAVGPIRDYLNKWYGYRAWQCRALVTVLAWIDGPEAVALLLDVARRFRTATIRKEAEVQARKLADRRRMTLAELADVSIPDAGLDASGRMVLDFGPRRFVARLDDDAEVVLEDEEGKALKALPSPAKSDDAENAAAAKGRLAALKKEVKAVRKRVVDRFQEALCTQRSWTFAAWQASLLRHPIAGRLCRRVVWAATSGGGPPATFRPLEDGSLTDLDDNPVELLADAEVRLAHRLTIGDEATDRWAAHLSDYEVAPLLPQAFGPASRLPEPLRRKTAWPFRAETPVALAIFGRRARGLGYDPGAFRLEDGGDRFLRHFPSASLCAAIELDDLDEADRVAGLTLSFLRAAEGQDARAGRRIALEEVPEVLLSECVADLSRIAGAASPRMAEEPVAEPS
ncbi:hypothetical protein OJF2_11300 [Aquisphaera giovannonii]|uniref:DUF4132 domain-containing protein n=1 Tax=Aquisphaera giovannonii TaxID=406548 RepID=A0A5B9VXP5_9BACT|nr:DUF4132 domain-containing protein [Aquisphaera giovannonii]QEH32651.1 hypothetical protein OJF2_11300 [Aquisphaera giovannonii]